MADAPVFFCDSVALLLLIVVLFAVIQLCIIVGCHGNEVVKIFSTRIAVLLEQYGIRYGVGNTRAPLLNNHHFLVLDRISDPHCFLIPEFRIRWKSRLVKVVNAHPRRLHCSCVQCWMYMYMYIGTLLPIDKFVTRTHGCLYSLRCRSILCMRPHTASL